MFRASTTGSTKRFLAPRALRRQTVLLAVVALAITAPVPLPAAEVDRGARDEASLGAPAILRPFTAHTARAVPGALELVPDPAAVAELKARTGAATVEVPVSDNERVTLELERFDVLAPNARFLSGRPGEDQELPRPDVVTLRGWVRGQPSSRAFLALTGAGGGNGYIDLDDGRRYFVSSAAPLGARAAPAPLLIHQDVGRGGLPEFPEFCGLSQRATLLPPAGGRVASRSAPLLGAPRAAFVAVEGDEEFVQLFGGDAFAAQAYVVQVLAAVSDIYIRDLDMKLVVARIRTWPNGGEPFGADDLSGFANYWEANEDHTGIHYVHMFSGRRDMSYAGIAYLTDPCSFAYGISGFLLGSFPTPVDGPDLGNWDVVVVAHEMGHNSGTGHTHDSYTPPIDQCGSAGISSRSDIMSYCHTTQGGLLNTDMRFHARVQAVIEATVAGTCLWFDCNGNNVDDLLDISGAVSADVNGNSVPDECEDCNGNGVLDSVEIGGGAADVNGNGIPDACEASCNGNALPDEYEITNALVADQNGNLVPDGCEPDCNGNAIADHAEIAGGSQLDVDRNEVPDVCQDCNANGLVDYIDVDRPLNCFVAQLADNVREYHRASGVVVRTLGASTLADPYDAVFGPDRQLYVASFGDDRVVRIDVDSGVAADFVPAGSGGLDGPTSLAFGPNGRLYVSSNLTNSVLEYNGVTGAFIRSMVASGGGGLFRPYGLTFGANGRLYVAGGDNTVREYNGSTGVFVSTFVAAGSGGLSNPRGLVFTPDGRLLVASNGTSTVLEYNSGGAFTRVFTNGVIPNGAWGIRLGPNGNLFVGRNTGQIRILEYQVDTGLYLRSFIRGDTGLTSPTGFDFRPPSLADCNGNGLPDECDIASGGASADCQPNGVPDECDVADGTSVDANGNGVPDECECVQLAMPLPDAAGPCIVDSDCPNRAVCRGGSCYVPRNRYLAVSVRDLLPGEPFAVRVTHVGSGRRMWVQIHTPGEPADVYRLGSAPYCRDWSAAPQVLYVTDCAVTPGETYEVQAVHCACSLAVEGYYSPPLGLPTTPQPAPKFWGDCLGNYSGGAWTPPNGVVNFDDVSGALRAFQLLPTAPHLSWVDLHDQEPNAILNFTDVQWIVKAFQGEAYPFAAPAACP
ncbi:MAG: hypothetical protein HY763_02575 [Planctomycetes bacterium]|nr:hypothetical protein [Planctomycetota bacterium]